MNIEEIKTQLAALTAAVEALSDTHAELRAAYKADPTMEIEVLGNDGTWTCFGKGVHPLFIEYMQYRRKPEAKPDTVRYYSILHKGEATLKAAQNHFHLSGVIKITHDGEGKLKSVEVVA